MPKIHRGMKTEFHLNFEGDHNEIFNALRGPELKFAYEQFLDSRMFIDDDDPDGGCYGRVEVKTVQELYDVLTALLGKQRDITLWAVGDADDLHCSLPLKDESQKAVAVGELWIDEDAVNNRLTKVLREASEILQAALNT